MLPTIEYHIRLLDQPTAPPVMIIDFHTHIFPPSMRNSRAEYLLRDATMASLFTSPEAAMASAEELIAAMDRARVDASVVLGMGWTDPDVAREANDYLIESAARFPGRLIPFCSVNPAWGEQALIEVERCALAGVKGVGELHPDTQGFRLSDIRLMAPLVEVVQFHSIILLTHSSEPVGHHYPGKGSATPSELMALIEAFPKLSLVCAHWGGGLPFYSLMPEVRTALANTYFDTAASPLLYSHDLFSLGPKLVDPGSLLLGSDFPLLEPGRLIQQVNDASLDVEERNAILGDNAQRLLNLTGRPSPGHSQVR